MEISRSKQFYYKDKKFIDLPFCLYCEISDFGVLVRISLAALARFVPKDLSPTFHTLDLRSVNNPFIPFLYSKRFVQAEHSMISHCINLLLLTFVFLF